MRLIFSALLLGTILGCTAKTGPHSLKYQHDGYDKATEPFQADFVAPHNGYLFPFRDLFVEAVFSRNTMIDIYVYDKVGKPVHLNDRMKTAVIEVNFPGVDIDREHNFSVPLTRGGSINHFRGKATVFNVKDIERAISLRLAFILPDPTNNFTQRQCHEGHWAVATPRVQDLSFSKAD
jgi:hypothetical protein